MIDPPRGVGVRRHRAPDQRDERGDVDDRPAPGPEQLGNAVLAAEIDPLQVDGHDPVPDRLLQCHHRPVVRREDPRVVVEHVEAAEPGDRLPDGVPNLILAPHVGLDEERLPAGAGDLGRRGRTGLGRHIHRDHPGAFARKGGGRQAAHSAAAPCDQDDLIAQSHRWLH